MINLIRSLIILIIIINIAKAEEVEKILFSLNDEIYTTVDLNNRINYLKMMSINNTNLTDENYLKDFEKQIITKQILKSLKQL